LVAGSTFNRFEERHALREQFESMRLLYVAATRAQDRLILSGTTKDLDKIGLKSDTWLNWIWQSLELPAQTRTGIVELNHDSSQSVQLQLTLNIADDESAGTGEQTGEQEDARAGQIAESADSIAEAFPLLRAVESERGRAVHRFSVTQLINYQRCPRQYYCDRVLHAPAPEALAVWNDAEAPEPPANLTATLKGAVIHRFCETYTTSDNSEEVLRRSFADILRLRQAELADRMAEINMDEGVAELLPLAQNYLSSAVFERVERARALSEPPADRGPRPGSLAGVVVAGGLPALVRNGFPSGTRLESGLWSELSFRLRRPLGILSGAIDKLLITPAANGKGFDVEIIDFKTNRLRPRVTGGLSSTSSPGPRASRPHVVAVDTNLSLAGYMRAGRPRSRHRVEQIAFEFDARVTATDEVVGHEASVLDRVRIAASDYQLQMQAYALAVAELMPSVMEADSAIVSTLHFLEPNEEFHLPAELLSPAACRRAIDDAMLEIVSSREPSEFPVRTATHCRMCSFLEICPAGRDWLRSLRQNNSESGLGTAVEAGR
jgi:ATP-dependent exoDNAse (exonuclease V) beta subunit